MEEASDQDEIIADSIESSALSQSRLLEGTQEARELAIKENPLSQVATQTRARRVVPLFIAGIAIAAALIGSFFLGKRAASVTPPAFHHLTFRNGTVWTAKFTPDGQNIVYSALWDAR